MENTTQNKMYQVSTLSALSLGYSRAVITVGELLQHGNIGLGTFEDVNGEMIVLDDHCYRATEVGSVTEAESERGVPFAAVTFMNEEAEVFPVKADSIDEIKNFLNLRIDEKFALNRMHVVRVDGEFEKVWARSETPHRSHHVSLKEVLQKTQRDFSFEQIRGSLVCVYYPDYMDGINAAGWHLHFISEDRTRGGHVFELKLTKGEARMETLHNIELRLPTEPAFDTYALKSASEKEIKEVEQGGK